MNGAHQHTEGVERNMRVSADNYAEIDPPNATQTRDHDVSETSQIAQNCRLVHSGRVTNIHRVQPSACEVRDHANGKDAIAAPIAVKTLKSKSANSNELKRFYHEYDILSSESLTACGAVRAALKKGRDDRGFPVIHLEWVDGITLAEWISRLHQRQNENFMNGVIGISTCSNFMGMARLALKIVQAVLEIHRAGVVHNDMSVENILVVESNQAPPEQDRETGGGGTSCSVKVIDFELAMTVESAVGLDAKELEWQEGDIHSLGAVLYELFSGLGPFSDSDKGDDRETEDLDTSTLTAQDDEGAQQKKRGKRNSDCLSPCAPLQEFNVPVSLSSLVSNMMRAADTYGSSVAFHRKPYQSLEEVHTDLRLMLLDPDRFLWNPYLDDPEEVGQLKIPRNKLYGRGEHVTMLMDVYHRTAGSSNGSVCEIAMITGQSGTGKSSLVEHVHKPIRQAGGDFIAGKFDLHGQGKPFSAIADAFNEHCKYILEYRTDDVGKIRATIRDEVGADEQVLIDLIPNLGSMIGPNTYMRSDTQETKSHPVRGVESQNRLNFLFQMFVRAISRPSRPLILFFDDLQWADGSSLELIRLLVSDAENKSLLFVGCYRDNEVDNNHPLTMQLRKIAKTGVKSTKIQLGALDGKSVNALVADALHLVPRLTESLASIVHRKTGGNPLFVIQFLMSLEAECLMQFSLNSWRWMWDVEAIQLKNVPNNVVDLMKSKMKKLSKDVQLAMKIASCLGRCCDERSLKCLDDFFKNN